MNYPLFLLTTRGIFFTLYRLNLIISRFGFSSKKMSKNLYAMVKIANQYGGKISFNITASVLERHSKLIKDLINNGAEFNSHGYIHTNYAKLNLNDQIEDLKKSIVVYLGWIFLKK